MTDPLQQLLSVWADFDHDHVIDPDTASIMWLRGSIVCSIDLHDKHVLSNTGVIKRDCVSGW